VPHDPTGPRLLGDSRVSPTALLDRDVIVGYPSKASQNRERDLSASVGATVGAGSILRSGTVIYEDVVIGDDVQTAHNVVIREGVRIGDGCVFGTNSVVREGATLGKNVRLMESVLISEGAVFEDDVFVGPNVSFTAGRYMTGALQASGQMSQSEAEALEGTNWQGPSVVVGRRARIGAGSVILAGVKLGAECVIAAGAIVSTDVPPGAMVAGNPARILRRAAE